MRLRSNVARSPQARGSARCAQPDGVRAASVFVAFLGAFAACPSLAGAAPVTDGPTLAASTAAASAAAVPSAAAPDLDRHLAGLTSWSADFEQRVIDGKGAVGEVSKGRLSIQKPRKFRWDYREPHAQLILADGRQLWFYDKDLAQANVRDLDSALANTPAMLLSAQALPSADFDVTALPASEGLEWFQLRPKGERGDFLAVRVGFRGGELRRMLLADKLNQVTRLEFSNVQRNTKFSPDTFEFTPPPGVDVIGQPVATP